MEVAPSQMEVVPSKMKVASSKIEVSPFFVDFHDLRTFVATYILSRFTHFFRQFFLAKIAFSATSHVFCMYVHSIYKNENFAVVPIANSAFEPFDNCRDVE